MHRLAQTSMHHLCLLGDLIEVPQNVAIAISEPVYHVIDANILTKLLDQWLCSSKIVSWHSWEQVMDGLELQSPMEKIKPWRTIDIHCCPQHSLWEAFFDTKI